MAVPAIDPSTARFPCCIVWTPLPVVSWLIPFVGHVGICRKEGVILDLAGPYFVSVDNFSFGAAARYVQLTEEQCCFPSDPSDHICHSGTFHSQVGTALSWDDGLRSMMQQFQHKAYNLFTCNCHSFVASCLNRLAYKGSSDWNVVTVVLLVLLKGKWVNKSAIVRSFAPFALVLSMGILLAGWPFIVGWAVFNIIFIGWFVIGTYVLRGLITY